ncbi:MAG TPA: hypothetical protein VIK77_04855 [Tissierellaceae bacterium]
MHPLKKLFLYPIAITAIIVLVTLCNWLLTAFFAWIFDTTMDNVASSPFVLIYIISTLSTLYLCIYACKYVDEDLL